MSQSATVKLARRLSAALQQYADEIESTIVIDAEPALEEAELPEGRGERQRSILELPTLATEQGLKTAEIAQLIEYEVPNTHSTLQALERAGQVEMVPGVSPQRWRLAPRYRPVGATFKRVASRVRRGEWTTYGDISLAVRGDLKASRGVGRAAATMADFPNPHRVLKEPGQIHPNWKNSTGGGPEECERLLAEEGVTFNEIGRALPECRITWDVLRERDESEPVPE